MSECGRHFYHNSWLQQQDRLISGGEDDEWHVTFVSWCWVFCLQFHVYNLIQPKFGSIHFPAQQQSVSVWWSSSQCVVEQAEQRKWKFDMRDCDASQATTWEFSDLSECRTRAGLGWAELGSFIPHWENISTKIGDRWPPAWSRNYSSIIIIASQETTH